MFTRRQFGFTGVGAAIVGLVSGSARAADTFEVSKSDAEWERILSKEQFFVLRKHGTEPPRSSPLDKTYDPGTYHCAGCDQPLFSSQANSIAAPAGRASTNRSTVPSRRRPTTT